MQLLTDPLVSTQWLNERLKDEDLRIFDASWYLPSMSRDARAEFAEAHLPGALFFDLDRLSDGENPLPHMMPGADQFADQMSQLGISTDDSIIVYDGMGIFSSPRAWWMFRSYGFKNVAVLDGGMPKWRAEARPLASTDRPATRRPLALQRDYSLTKTHEQVAEASRTSAAEMIDTRPRGRFTGVAREPREGMRSGHIPGARSLPFTELLNADGTMKSAAQLRETMASAGIDLTKPAITTCGSGVTAAIINLALVRIGKSDHALYDGSWSEWGGRNDLPIETGEA